MILLRWATNDASCILIVRVWACFAKEVILSVP